MLAVWVRVCGCWLVYIHCRRRGVRRCVRAQRCASAHVAARPQCAQVTCALAPSAKSTASCVLDSNALLLAQIGGQPHALSRWAAAAARVALLQSPSARAAQRNQRVWRHARSYQRIGMLIKVLLDSLYTIDRCELRPPAEPSRLAAGRRDIAAMQPCSLLVAALVLLAWPSAAAPTALSGSPPVQQPAAHGALQQGLASSMALGMRLRAQGDMWARACVLAALARRALDPNHAGSMETYPTPRFPPHLRCPEAPATLAPTLPPRRDFTADTMQRILADVRVGRWAAATEGLQALGAVPLEDGKAARAALDALRMRDEEVGAGKQGRRGPEVAAQRRVAWQRRTCVSPAAVRPWPTLVGRGVSAPHILKDPIRPRWGRYPPCTLPLPCPPPST